MSDIWITHLLTRNPMTKHYPTTTALNLLKAEKQPHQAISSSARMAWTFAQSPAHYPSGQNQLQPYLVYINTQRTDFARGNVAFSAESDYSYICKLDLSGVLSDGTAIVSLGIFQVSGATTVSELHVPALILTGTLGAAASHGQKRKVPATASSCTGSCSNSSTSDTRLRHKF